MAAYAELQVTSNFSFLRGGSHPEELVQRAVELGLEAIALTDRNTLAGIVRGHVAAKEAGLRFVVGARLDLIGSELDPEPSDGGRSLLCFPTDRAAYSRLSQLISLGQRRAPKGQCRLGLDDVIAHGEGQIVVTLPPEAPDQAFATFVTTLRRRLAGPVYLAAQHLYRGDDALRIETLARLAESSGTPLLATGDVLYHTPERRSLQDVLSCIREHTTIDQAGYRLEANAERHLKSAAEMARLFRRHEEAVARTQEIARACRFSLDELRYDYPIDPAPDGLTVQQHLERLTWAGARERYPPERHPEGIPAKIRALIEHEFQLIEELGYAPYFLTVHDIVRFARSQGILCQGRGSAANSAVCYCLGITAVDPERFDLLFERFVSAERNEPPDIDVDFEHERREEVIQYIYAKYGREHAGIAATVIHYRARRAIREVGKAMGLSEDAVGALASGIWGWSEGGIDERLARERGLDPNEPRLRLALALARELTGFPRHLSQHVGGFVLTRSRLDQVVPVVNAAMEDRTIVEWDKDDLDALGILKIDVLALGMLTCIRKGFELLRRHHGIDLDLATVPAEDPAVYEMLSRADSLGVFQVESRAQMSMLPRLRPRCFYDLVIEVAIVRPGPIQGDMVHPYLRRRSGEERVDYPSAELEGVLKKTLGVPLFQEQAMQIAIVAAGFTPSQSDQLRRAMATFRRVGTIHHFQGKFIEGMVANGYEHAFAERCFKQIEGFGSYGFPESHAASFALLVYVSSWLKCHHPEVFACALLNSQPMGFYAPAQIVRDARDHGVTVLPVDVTDSDWDCTLEMASPVEMAASRIEVATSQAKAATPLAEASRSQAEVAVLPASRSPSFSASPDECPVNPSSTIHRQDGVSSGPCDPGNPSTRQDGPGTDSRRHVASSGGSAHGHDERPPGPGGQEARRGEPGMDSQDRMDQTKKLAAKDKELVNVPMESAPVPMQLAPAAQRDGSDVTSGLHAAPSGSRVPGDPGDDERRPGLDGRYALRLGFRQVKGLKQEEMERLVARRGNGWVDLAELRHRAGIGAAALDRLARADAFGSLALDRRRALWSAIGLDRTGRELDLPPLFAWAEGRTARAEPEVALPAMTLGREVVEDYANLRLTLRAHPLALLRRFLGPRVVRAEQLAAIDDGRFVEVAGLVLVRQRPGTASGVIFITLEDESGIANLVIWPKLFERFRRVVMAAQLMVVRGKLQKEGLVIHVIADRLDDRTDLLARLGETDATFEAPVARADRLKPGRGRGRARPQRRHSDPEPTFETPLARADEVERPGRDHRDGRPEGFRSRDFH